MRTLTF